jgi:endonuclease/exonuclease/phosphatase family metal-dependent hydrolase
MLRRTLLALSAVVAIGFASTEVEAGPGGRTRARIMSFNIRFDFPDDGPNRWQFRVATVAKVIRESQAFIACLQEDKRDQIDDLKPLLPGWQFMGKGRNGGNSGEHCSIAVDTEHVRVRENGSFWLSDTPEVEGSNTWGDRYPRVVTWALVEIRKSKTPVLVLNAHLPEGGGNNHELRVKGARVIQDWIAKRVPARERDKVAVIVTGDFNSEPGDEPRAALVGEAGDGVRLRDGWTEAAPQDGSPGTYGSFRGLRTTSRIDWIMIGGPIKAIGAQKLDEQVDGRWPSDHYPVMVDVELR